MFETRLEKRADSLEFNKNENKREEKRMDNSTHNKKVKSSKAGYMATRGERVSYGLYFVGQNIFYILLMLFLTPFFTDVGIPAGYVAIIALAVKAWDAINDPIFGGFVDKIKFKSGKFLPWLRISLVAIPTATIFLFALPSGLPLGVKVAWAVVAYILWDTAYTVCDVPIFGLVTTMTNNQRERTGFMTIGRVCGMTAAIVVTIVVPNVRESIGGWLPSVLIMSALATAIMLPICFKAKERVKPADTVDEPSLFKLIAMVFKNKYMFVFFGAVFLAQSMNIGNTVSMYFARYALGDESLMTLTVLAVMIPTVLVGFFVPFLLKRFDKYHLFIVGTIGSIVMICITYFVGFSNLTIYLGLLVLKGIPSGLVTMLMFMFTPDCVEYGLYTTKTDASGIIFSIQTFTVKLTAALATSIGALVLFLIGFVEGENAVQPANFVDDLWLWQNVLPVVGLLVSLLLLSKYKLRERDVQIMAKCNSGEMSRGEAETLLADSKF